jgi:serine-type D-Ala-D-Ala carboxypeptidase/endopeptidase
MSCRPATDQFYVRRAPGTMPPYRMRRLPPIVAPLLAAPLLTVLAACSSSSPGENATDAAAPTDAAGEALTLVDAADAGPTDLPSAADLQAWLQPLFDQGYVHGMALGLVDPTGSVVHGYGTVGDAGVPPAGDTIFQIGSITKTFTGLWLATQLVDGGLQANEPVQSLLPSAVTVPSYEGTAITLQDLATHTSGLPDAPTNLAPADPLNPWADYTVQDLYTFVSGYSLTYAPGTQWVYSNIGEGLLGLALSLRAGGTVNDSIQSVIAGPLGLVDTTAVLSASQQQRFAQGYDGDLNPIEPWSFTEAIAGAGELRSTVDDLLKYAEAQTGLASTPLAMAMTLSHQPIHPTSISGYDIGINWILSTDGKIVWHNGGVYGGMAFVGFDPGSQKAVVVLIDTGAENVTTSLGWDPLTSVGLSLVQWLDGTPPPSLASILPPAATLTPAELQPFVGDYAITGAGTVAVSLQGSRLSANAPAIWPRPIVLYPASATTFVCREVPATGSFQTGQDGGVDGITLNIEGQKLTGTKQ